MADPLSCVRGHQWPAGTSDVCPACGLPADTRERSVGAADADTTLPAPAGPRPAPGLPTIPGYTVQECIGEGGMAVVYRAWQISLKRTVAIKMLKEGRHARPEERARFRREAEAMARLDHPHIVPIYEVGEADAGPYFITEYLEGGSLARRLVGPLPWSFAERARLVEQLARAIHHAHERGVLHRDLKPANVLLTRDGVPKVADFGLAKRMDGQSLSTPTGAIFGTPGYMPPEQTSGAATQIGPAADVYGLGAVLYALLTGRPPFAAETWPGFVKQVLHDDPVPPRRLQPDVPADLETICLKCLEKKPRQRYASALALAEDLERFQKHEPIKARPPGPLGRLVKWSVRRPAAAALVAVSVLAAAALVTVSLAYSARVQAESERVAANARRADENARRAREAADVMVRELAQRLKPLASTQSATVEQILQRAVSVYRTLLETDQSPDTRAGWGELQNLAAELYLEMNNTGRANECLEDALATFRRLDTEHPNTPRHLAGQARTLELRGQTAAKQGNLPAALESFQQARALCERLHQADPADPARQSDLAAVVNWVGIVLEYQGDLLGAEQHYRRAFDLRAQVVARHADNPQWRFFLARNYEKLGDLEFDRQPAAALQHYADALAIYEALVKEDVINVDWQKGRTRVLTSMGQIYRAQEGKAADADKLFQRAQALTRQFTELNPDSVVWQRELLRTRLQLAYLHAPTTNPEKAKALKECLQTIGELYRLSATFANQDPLSAEWQDDLANLQLQIAALHWQLAEVEERDANLARALEALKDGLRIQEDLLRRDSTRVHWVQRRFAFHLLSGVVLQAQGAKGEAAAAFLTAYRHRLDAAERLTRLYPQVPAWQEERTAAIKEARQSLMGTVLPYYDDPLHEPADADWLTRFASAFDLLARVEQLEGRPDEAKEAQDHADTLRRLAEQVRAKPVAKEDRRMRLTILAALARIEPGRSYQPVPFNPWADRLIAECRTLADQLPILDANEQAQARADLEHGLGLLADLQKDGRLRKKQQSAVAELRAALKMRPAKPNN